MATTINTRRKQGAGRLVLPACAALLAVVVGCRTPLQVHTTSDVTIKPLPPAFSTEPLAVMTLRSEPCAAGRIAIVDVDGLLLNTNMVGPFSDGENPVALFREKLDCLAADTCLAAVVVRINTPGGGVTATDIMWHDLTSFKARTHRPVVACLMDVAAGGGYYLATAADHIMAHPTAITGGIGVILNTYNMHDMMTQIKIVSEPVKAGVNTDLGSPASKLNDDGRKLLQEIADEYHARFERIVNEARPQHDPHRREDFDGRVFTAQQAQQRGLIDSTGYLDDAVETARQMAGGGPVQLVLLHRCADQAFNPYAITPNIPIQTSVFSAGIPGLDRTRLPTFLYIWQSEPSIERMSGR